MNTGKRNYESQFTMKLDGRAVNGTAQVRAMFFSEAHEFQLKKDFADLGWRYDLHVGPGAASLAAQLCHAPDSGLESNPETAEKVAAWLFQYFDIMAR